MKKIISFFLAALIALSAFCTCSFADSEMNESVKLTSANRDVIFLEDGKEINLSEFAGKTNVTVCVFGKGTYFDNDISDINVPSSADEYEISKPVFVIFNQNEGAKHSIQVPGYADGKKYFKWFSFDVFNIFGKNVLSFFYEPELDASSEEWLNILIEESEADYLYFDTLNGRKNVYIKVDKRISAEDIENINSGNMNSNPGFFCKIAVSLCKIGMPEKSKYNNDASGRFINWIVSKISSWGK